LVKAGTSEVVYVFKVPQGYVAFVYWIGVSRPAPEGSSASWFVDGEKVDWQREFGDVPVGSLEKPTCVDPPFVVRQETWVEIFSPVDWEFTVYLDGLLYELPVGMGGLVKVKDELSANIDKIVEGMKQTLVETTGEVKTQVSELKPMLEPEKETVFRDKWKNVDISKKYIILEEEGHGSLHELLIKSTTTDFNVHLEADGKILYDGSYSDISSEPQFLSEQSAFEDPDNAGTYYLQVKDITFSKRIFAYVWGSGTLSEIYIRYSKKV
jgi:hypothetical protein